MKKILLFALCFVALNFSFSASAQVTIGDTSDPKATLDVKGVATDNSKSDGILVPRLTASQLQAKTNASATYGQDQNSSIVYVTAADIASPVNKMEKVTAPGFYFFKYVDGTTAGDRWLPLGSGDPVWFYLPSTKIDTEQTSPTPGQNKTLNLFNAYKTEVNQSVALNTDPNASNPDNLGYTVKSTGAPDISKALLWSSSLAANSFYYYVVGFDSRVFRNISIDANGLMTYQIVPNSVVDEATFINIVLVKR